MHPSSRYHLSSAPQSIRSALRVARAIAVVTLLFTLCAGTGFAFQDDSATPVPLAGEGDASKPCFDGRLRIRDLEGAQESLAEGLTNVDEIAKAWKPDARLVTLRLGCPLLETGYQWEGTYFSEQVQAFFETDTRAVQASEDDPTEIPTLSPEGIEIRPVYVSLMRAGFDEGSQLGAVGGLTIRPSTDAQPFGPPSAPRNDVYFHVSILERGQVIDVWVAARNGTIYRYEVES